MMKSDKDIKDEDPFRQLKVDLKDMIHHEIHNEMEQLTKTLMKSLRAEIDCLKVSNDELKETVTRLEEENRLLKVDMKEITEKVDHLTRNVPINDDKFIELSGKVAEHKIWERSVRNKIDELTLRADDQEDRSKRNNLIFYGFKEETGFENQDLIESKVTKVLLTHGLFGDAKIDIDRAHRMGKKKDNDKPRPIVVRFSHYQDKEKIIHNSKLLKGTNIRITEQYSRGTVEVNNQLFAACKDAKDKDERIQRFWINYRYAKVLFVVGSKTVYKNYNLKDVARPNWYKINIH